MSRTRFVALPRGINVGGSHKVPMADLRAMFEALGHTAVESYVQSGNIAFSAASDDAVAEKARIEAAFAERFGFRSSFALRTKGELERIVANNPYLEREPVFSRLHVVFLTGDPDPEVVAKVDPRHGLPDEFVLDGREVFVWYPSGAGRTKLRLEFGVPGTARNWNTVLRLAEMVRAEP